MGHKESNQTNKSNKSHTLWESDKSTRKCHIQKGLEVSSFPAGEYLLYQLAYLLYQLVWANSSELKGLTHSLLCLFLDPQSI